MKHRKDTITNTHPYDENFIAMHVGCPSGYVSKHTIAAFRSDAQFIERSLYKDLSLMIDSIRQVVAGASVNGIYDKTLWDSDMWADRAVVLRNEGLIRYTFSLYYGVAVKALSTGRFIV